MQRGLRLYERTVLPLVGYARQMRSDDAGTSKTNTVRILRVILKGRQTTRDAVGRKP